MRRVVFIVYPGFQLLDLAGAAAVFAGAESKGTRLYQVSTASDSGGLVPSGSGIVVQTTALGSAFTSNDTVILPGADEAALRHAMEDSALLARLRDAAQTAARIGAVCTGAFLLASAGLLDGRKAVMHWASATRFTAEFPRVILLAEPIYAEDGGVWTSAGTTTGIDMALEMVKRDHGNAPAHDIARLLRGARARARLGAST